MSTPSADAQAAFDAIVETLGDEVQRTRMMGSAILMRAGGRMLSCLDGDVYAVKLGRDTEEHRAAMAVPGAAVWSPQESGRDFSGWVGLPLAQRATWLHWTRAAIDLHDEAQASDKPLGKRPKRPSGGGGGL